jgi:Zn-dependent protease with chaperone function
MDFFEHQEVARKLSGRLVLLFGLAVLGTVLATYIVVALFVTYLQQPSPEQADLTGGMAWEGLWNAPLLLAVGGGVILLVGGATLFKLAQLRAGGHVVAEMLGGRRIEPGSSDLAERRLLNVVEEMAIASGMPVPMVFLLDREAGINAFAAGHGVDDAVIGVTRGALDTLTRDELQGVIAHEFSHILNGDMRLNLRLMGVVYGILVIGLAGWMILRSARFHAATRSRRDRGGGAVLAWLALGVALWIIGAIGTLFGNLMKAAVSRQRELLADASAVQFTRNPAGIAGALKKIGGFAAGSDIEDVHAKEVSHMLFDHGRSMAALNRGWLGPLLSTHPRLEERIRRIDPSFRGEFPEVIAGPETAGLAPAAAAPSPMLAASAARRPLPPSEPRPSLQPAPAGLSSMGLLAGVVAQMGQVTPAHIDYARALLDALPAPLRAAAQDPYQARLLVYALLLDPEAAIRSRQREVLAQLLDAADADAVRRLEPLVDTLPLHARLPLLETALPALAELAVAQADRLQRGMDALLAVDRHVDVFDFALSRIVRNHLGRRSGRMRAPRVRHDSLEGLRGPCSVLLSALAQTGQPAGPARAAAFQAGAQTLGLAGLALLEPERCDFAALDTALGTLATLAPRLKKQLLNACAACIAADRVVTTEEAELFRAIADSLDCPAPPLLSDPTV